MHGEQVWEGTWDTRLWKRNESGIGRSGEGWWLIFQGGIFFWEWYLMGNGSRSGGDRWYGTLIFDLGRVIHKFIDWPCNIRGGIRGSREMEWGPSMLIAWFGFRCDFFRKRSTRFLLNIFKSEYINYYTGSSLIIRSRDWQK